MSIEQLTLDAAPGPSADGPDRVPLDVRYARWVDANPRVIHEIAATARQLRAKGKRVSINRCFEEMRERVHTVGDEFVLNNSFRALAARDVMSSYPDLAGVFRLRTRKAGR